MIDHYLRN